MKVFRLAVFIFLISCSGQDKASQKNVVGAMLLNVTSVMR